MDSKTLSYKRYKIIGRAAGDGHAFKGAYTISRETDQAKKSDVLCDGAFPTVSSALDGATLAAIREIEGWFADMNNTNGSFWR